MWLNVDFGHCFNNKFLEGWEEAKVEVLINEATRTWNENIVDGLFVLDETALIKKIPLLKHPTKDKLYWPWT